MTEYGPAFQIEILANARFTSSDIRHHAEKRLLLFVYGNLQNEGDDPNGFYTRYGLARILKKVGHATVTGKGSLWKIETTNKSGERINHPAFLEEREPNPKASIRGTLFEIILPKSIDLREKTEGTPEAHVEEIIRTASSSGDLLAVFDYIEGFIHTNTPSHQKNYFYRTNIECESEGKKYMANIYALNFNADRLQKNGGPARIIEKVSPM
jgi:hypothetical protein